MQGGGGGGEKKRNNLFVTRSLSLNGGHQRKGPGLMLQGRPPLTRGKTPLRLPVQVLSIPSVYWCTSCCLLFTPPLCLFIAASSTEAEVEGRSSLLFAWGWDIRGGSILTEEESNHQAWESVAAAWNKKPDQPPHCHQHPRSEVETANVCIAEDYCSLWSATVAPASVADDLKPDNSQSVC